MFQNRQVINAKKTFGESLLNILLKTPDVSHHRISKTRILFISEATFFRFYDPEGPPVGIVYERPEDERAALNPDL